MISSVWNFIMFTVNAVHRLWSGFVKNGISLAQKWFESSSCILIYLSSAVCISLSSLVLSYVCTWICSQSVYVNESASEESTLCTNHNLFFLNARSRPWFYCLVIWDILYCPVWLCVRTYKVGPFACWKKKKSVFFFDKSGCNSNKN